MVEIAQFVLPRPRQLQAGAAARARGGGQLRKNVVGNGRYGRLTARSSPGQPGDQGSQLGEIVKPPWSGVLPQSLPASREKGGIIAAEALGRLIHGGDGG